MPHTEYDENSISACCNIKPRSFENVLYKLTLYFSNLLILICTLTVKENKRHFNLIPTTNNSFNVIWRIPFRSYNNFDKYGPILKVFFNDYSELTAVDTTSPLICHHTTLWNLDVQINSSTERLHPERAKMCLLTENISQTLSSYSHVYADKFTQFYRMLSWPMDSVRDTLFNDVPNV